jgi:hypothetical protein
MDGSGAEGSARVRSPQADLVSAPHSQTREPLCSTRAGGFFCALSQSAGVPPCRRATRRLPTPRPRQDSAAGRGRFDGTWTGAVPIQPPPSPLHVWPSFTALPLRPKPPPLHTPLKGSAPGRGRGLSRSIVRARIHIPPISHNPEKWLTYAPYVEENRGCYH